VERAWIGVADSGREWRCKAWEFVELETSTRGSVERVLAGESRVDGVEKKKGWRRLGGRGLFIWEHLCPGSTLPPRACWWRFRGEVNQAAAAKVRGVFRRNLGAEAETSE
jgi:hypothetical protein